MLFVLSLVTTNFETLGIVLRQFLVILVVL